MAKKLMGGQDFNWGSALSIRQYSGESTRARQKSKPLGKIRYLWNCSKFFLQIYNAYREGFRPHIVQISLQYSVVFKCYIYLNINVHFSK